MAIKAVIFDLDGVLARADYQTAAEFFGRLLPISLPQLIARWERWLQKGGAQPVEGTSLWTRFWDHVSDELELAPDIRRQLHGFSYLQIYQALPDARPALLEARRLGLRTGVLSNTPLVDLGELLQAVGLSDLIDTICIPQGRGVAKPEPAAYLNVVQALGVTPEQCLFFDDEASNVAGAVKVGIRSYLVDRKRASDALAEGCVRDLSPLATLLIGSGLAARPGANGN
jgi:HAD superfamily hydrolase (TIGR01509 family)